MIGFDEHDLISSKKLYKCVLIDDVRTWNEATIFPFFDREGKIRMIMLIMPDLGPVYLFKADPNSLEIDVYGQVRLHGEPALLPEMSLEKARTLEPLWHYDPWWVLMNPPYKDQEWVPQARASNCPDYFSEVYYARDLSRVVKACGPKNRGRKIVPFETAMMPPPREGMGPNSPIRSLQWGGDWRWRKAWT
jgi:hypothetical protein